MTIIHGHSPWGQPATPEYRAYHAMKTRCTNPKSKRYKDYGGRGIAICDRWLAGDGVRTGFECFFEDMGPKPSPNHTVDRRNNDHGYAPENCRWSTRVAQARNTRVTRWVEIAGERMSFAEAVERFGKVSNSTARMRVKRGMDDVAAITTPPLPNAILTRAAERITVVA